MAEIRTRWVTTAGNLSNLRMKTEEISEPGAKEVQIAVEAVGFNFADLFACLGLYSATPEGEFTPGLEFSGVVTKAGSDSDLAAGERVMGATRFGGYSTDLNIDSRYVRRLPEGWDFRQGAGFLTQCLTAWYGLMELGGMASRKAKSPTVLIHSAAGGVGLFACDIVKGSGGAVIATVGSEGKVDFLVSRTGLKREQIIVRRGGGNTFGKQLDAALMAVGRKGLDIVFDSLGGDYFMPAYARMNAMGRHVQFGAASMTPHGGSPNWPTLAYQWLTRPKLDPLEMISENKAVIGFNLIWLWDQVHELEPVLDAMIDFGFRPPPIGLARPFQEADSALREFQQGMTVGKVVLDVGDRTEIAKAASEKMTRSGPARDFALAKWVPLLVVLAIILPYVIERITMDSN